VLQLIKKMPSLLKMPGLQVTPDYVDAFFRADNSFLYQLVFDPVHRKLMPLNPYPDDVNPAELRYAGPYPFWQKTYVFTRSIDVMPMYLAHQVSNEQAFQLSRYDALPLSALLHCLVTLTFDLLILKLVHVCFH